MARPRQERSDRWYLPKTDEYYYLGYCFKRFNKVHLFLSKTANVPNIQKKATHLPWTPKNKPIALSMLAEEIAARMATNSGSSEPAKAHTVSSLIREYGALHYPNNTALNIKKKNNAIDKLINEECLNFTIEANVQIRLSILDRIQKSTLNPNTINKYLEYIKQIFAYAVEEGYISRNPISKNLFMTPKPIDKYTPTRAEFDTIVEYFEKQPQKEIFTKLLKFIGITGARIHECLKIKAEDIKDGFILIHGKGSRDRTFPITPFPELKKLLNDIPPTKGKIFPWNAYAKLELWIRNAHEALETPEDKRWSFHDIRTMRENEFIYDERLDPVITAQILGHTVETQRKHYLKLLGPERLSSIIEKRGVKMSEA